MEETTKELSSTQVEKSVLALYQYGECKKKKNTDAFGEVSEVGLQICLKKASPLKQMIKINLPHCSSTDMATVCLFVKDIDRTSRDFSQTVEHYNKLMMKKGIKTIPHIIPLKSLKLEFQSYEAKRNLANQYDLFLADERIIRLLPSYLGKHFYGKNKLPIQVNLMAKDLKKEMYRSLHCTFCEASGRGSVSYLKLADVSMPQNFLVENIHAAVTKLSSSLPGGFDNIRSLNIKTTTSPAIPIYISTESGKEVDMKPSQSVKLDEPEELSTIDRKIRVLPNKSLQFIEIGDTGNELKYLEALNEKSESVIENYNNYTAKRKRRMGKVVPAKVKRSMRIIKGTRTRAKAPQQKSNKKAKTGRKHK